MTDQLRELVTQIVKRLVDNPDKIKISVNAASTSVMLEISAAKGDLGKIIGKKGRTIEAIRTIMNSVTGKTGSRIYIDVKNNIPEMFRGRI
jgi:predicted RNA-binding protein YlqC (UPF0109 family)